MGHRGTYLHTRFPKWTSCKCLMSFFFQHRFEASCVCLSPSSTTQMHCGIEIWVVLIKKNNVISVGHFHLGAGICGDGDLTWLAFNFVRRLNSIRLFCFIMKAPVFFLGAHTPLERCYFRYFFAAFPLKMLRRREGGFTKNVFTSPNWEL